MCIANLPYLGAKETASAIRKVLRKAFPACQFSVTTGRGSGVSSVRIAWTDGPTTGRVDALVAGFEAGHFDGMTDSYNYDRNTALIVEGKAYRPGCRYVFTERTASVELIVKASRACLAYWELPDNSRATLTEVTDALDGAKMYGPEYNRFWEAVRYERVGNLDFGQLVNRAMSDRTSVTPGHS